MTNIAMENDIYRSFTLLKMMIFHSYVSLPEGSGNYKIGEIPHVDTTF